MTTRLNVFAAGPAPMKAMMAISAAVDGFSLETSLKELVKIRASQINGCGFCLHMHLKDAVKLGESVERIVLLDAWRESPLFTDRERAALAFTEAVTELTKAGVADPVYEELARHFSPAEQVELMLAIGVINMWNRINVGFAVVHPGTKAG
ncbi:carboxymuconolactone decarboxylase family protein [Phreatobacter sp.]|uniref:carboxymuconolactone decarboxylase family protein n=1 Tax=Phreatobacter sp. TaxID=1966341 RepID=UPI003F7102AD